MDSICPRSHVSKNPLFMYFLNAPLPTSYGDTYPTLSTSATSLQRSAPEWIQLILNPSAHLGLKPQDAHTFTLLVAITCDRIWWSRNKLDFDSSLPTSPVDIAADINKTFSAHSNV